MHNTFCKYNIGWTFAGIDVQLKRRYDLIPNLIQTVKGYATHKETLFQHIAESRAQALNISKYYIVVSIIALIFLIIGIDVYFSEFRHKTITRYTPTFQDGDGRYYRPDSPFRDKLTQTHNGEKLVMHGRVLRKDCKTAMKNIILDIWQAST